MMDRTNDIRKITEIEKISKCIAPNLSFLFFTQDRFFIFHTPKIESNRQPHDHDDDDEHDEDTVLVVADEKVL